MGVTSKVVILGIFSLGLIWTAVLAHPDGHDHINIFGGPSPAVTIRTGTGEVVVINPSTDSSFLEQLGSVMPFYSRSITAVILTDAADTSLNGLANLTARYHVEMVWLPSDQITAPAGNQQQLTGEQSLTIADLDITSVTINQVANLFVRAGQHSLGILGKQSLSYWQSLPPQSVQQLVVPALKAYTDHQDKLQQQFHPEQIIVKKSATLIW